MHALTRALFRCVAFGRPKMSVWGHASARSRTPLSRMHFIRQTLFGTLCSILFSVSVRLTKISGRSRTKNAHGSQHRRTGRLGRLCALTAGSPSGSAAPGRKQVPSTSTDYCRVSKNFKFVLVLVCQLWAMGLWPPPRAAALPTAQHCRPSR